MNRTTQWLLAGGALLAAVGTGVVSYERIRDQLAVIDACQATEIGDWTAALAQTRGRVGADPMGRAAAECRCLALLATGGAEKCSALMSEILGQPETKGWAPNATLAIHLIQTWRDDGRSREAADLARRASARHPDDADLFYLELVTRGGIEDEASVLRELEARLPETGAAAARMRTSLANRYLLRGEPRGALGVLGDTPPLAAGDALGPWFDARGMAFASEGDLAGVQRNLTEWKRAGGDPAELHGRYALSLSIAGLKDPQLPPLVLLRSALALGDRIGDPKLHEALTIRLVLSLVQAGELDAALAAYDRGRERFALEGLSRAELERSASHRRLRGDPSLERRGTLRFSVPRPEPGDVLLISPEPDAPLDAGYESLAVPAAGRIAVERSLGEAPQRWVYRDARGRTRASGTVNPRPGAERNVSVETSVARPALRAALHRAPADGRRRVMLLILDCADWRVVQYLRARGELPVLDAMLRTGYRAVLDSDPPLTAAALEALVWPRRHSGASFLGLIHQFGVELAGLASIGDNPVGGLAWLLPEHEDLFSAIGAGDLSAANLLFAHGGIAAGRHSEVTGPHGERRRVALATVSRDLDADERERWPGLAATPRERDRVHVRTIAAELDAAADLASARDVDFVALRVEPLDILTHAHFAAAVREGQDDGEGLLFSVYRYIDARLGEIHDRLDEDDLLLVMSDHGIRTAMEHSRHALFVATGRDAPAARAEGQPALRGVSRVVADLLGVATDWPDTGVARWAAAPEAATKLATVQSKTDPRNSRSTP